jgi:hypothetical protein
LICIKGTQSDIGAAYRPSQKINRGPDHRERDTVLAAVKDAARRLPAVAQAGHP